MSRSHTQSVVQLLVENSVQARDYRAICPVIFTTDALNAAGVFGVKGTMLRNGAALDFEERWVTLNPDQVANFWKVGEKDGTIRTVRITSLIAGNRYGAGSEEAFLIELNGSPEAEKLAAKYGVNYDFTSEVGEEKIPVTHHNPIIITQSAYLKMMGLAQFDGVDKPNRPSRADRSNPEMLAALAYADANNNQLPAREKIQTGAGSRVNTSFKQFFPNVGQRRGRTYNNNAAPQAPDDDEI